MFSPDGKLVETVLIDKTIGLWDSSTEAMLKAGISLVDYWSTIGLTNSQ